MGKEKSTVRAKAKPETKAKEVQTQNVEAYSACSQFGANRRTVRVNLQVTPNLGSADALSSLGSAALNECVTDVSLVVVYKEPAGDVPQPFQYSLLAEQEGVDFSDSDMYFASEAVRKFEESNNFQINVLGISVFPEKVSRNVLVTFE